MDTIVSKIPDRKAFLKGEKTLEIGYPWLSFGAIIALEVIANKDMKVLEFGSGGSTIFWANNCSSVKSLETNKDWYKKVVEATKGFDNVELILANSSKIFEIIDREPQNFYDIVLVDPHPTDILRLSVANRVVSKIKRGGYLIVDNYLKHGMENFNYPKSEIYTFDELRFSGKGTRICKLK